MQYWEKRYIGITRTSLHASQMIPSFNRKARRYLNNFVSIVDSSNLIKNIEHHKHIPS
jgi:hypothetical protein